MLVNGLVGFAAASGIGGLAKNSGMLLAARSAQGVFASGMAPAAPSVLAATFTVSGDRAPAFGVFGAAAGNGQGIGLILGGALTESASWRWTLLVKGPIELGGGNRSAACDPPGPGRTPSPL